VREALFGILGSVEGARALDLYAGSGALAIEALSRGAARAVLVERDRHALAAIRKNLSTLGETSRALVLPLDVGRALRALEPEAPFDLVLCDPPWSIAGEAVAAVGRLAEAGLLTEDARVVIEHAAKEAPGHAEGLDSYDGRTFGDTGLGFFRPRRAT
jgi:16S rRNA (guanine966-N2)-methyltransferase